METGEMLRKAREIWPEQTGPLHIGVAMGVVYGDICRRLRDAHEGAPLNKTELKKELGNMLFSTIRWCDDLGLTPEECIEAAIEAQRAYRSRQKTGN